MFLTIERVRFYEYVSRNMHKEETQPKTKNVIMKM